MRDLRTGEHRRFRVPGQPKGLVRRGDKIYAAIYPSGEIIAIDIGTDGVTSLGFLGYDQQRPADIGYDLLTVSLHGTMTVHRGRVFASTYREGGNAYLLGPETRHLATGLGEEWFNVPELHSSRARGRPGPSSAETSPRSDSTPAARK
ncbi:hypothetical protein [Nonomuraea dietziae]|uniref:hypothetical protein n=1 Tax=Nonomuraea dietziae TaxID=65515 RepID=UPI0034284AEB